MGAIQNGAGSFLQKATKHTRNGLERRDLTDMGLSTINSPRTNQAAPAAINQPHRKAAEEWVSRFFPESRVC